MKNAEKFQEIFKEFATEVWAFPEKDFLTWLNAEYKEPTKNDPKFCPDRKGKTTHMETLLHCVEDECVAYKDGKCLKYNSDQEPTTKNNLGVEEVTALAEWTEKLTEANKSAYSQGYADGMKAQAEQKTGHWKIKRASIHPYGNDVACSECGFTMSSSFGYKYCPNCGAKMESEE